MRLLDLFCGAGGAAKGYADAGYIVTGVDLNEQPRYPYTFIKADVMRLPIAFLQAFDIIHASPPCQAYSTLSKGMGTQHRHPDLVAPTREMLLASGKPYIIENVPGAPLNDPHMLCGTMFPELRVIRHRLFETTFPLTTPHHGTHPSVYTNDKRNKNYGIPASEDMFFQVTEGGSCTLHHARKAMDIAWMNKHEVCQSIPPAYTRYIGKTLRGLL